MMVRTIVQRGVLKSSLARIPNVNVVLCTQTKKSLSEGSTRAGGTGGGNMFGQGPEKGGITRGTG